MIEKRNFKINKNIKLDAGLLNGQGCGNLATCRYGFFPMSYNGCEIIAVYNLSYLLGRYRPLCEIAREIYPYGNAFSGLFGTWPSSLERYFRDNDFPVVKVRKYELFKKAFYENRLAVISFWNSNTIFKGLHTVCIENIGSGIRVYNHNNSCDHPVIYKHLDDYMDARRFICGYYSRI
jgi:hypothetical protein